METPIYRIVVAEDEELLLNNLLTKIKQTNLGFEVIGKAQTGSHALELVKEHIPDLLITDIKMPVMTGIELLEKVYPQFPTIKTMIISGFSDFEYAQKAITFHVESYLLKPIDTEELYQSLLNVRTTLELEQQSYRRIFNESITANTPTQIAHMLKEYIVHNYNQEINLNSIAHNMNYSSSYLTKIFNQTYNTTPNKYMISLRIQQAQQLLIQNKSLSIRQIGEIVGYPEQGYFSRIFKKQTGSSPFDYRDSSK